MEIGASQTQKVIALTAIAVGALVCLPIASVLYQALVAPSDLWSHLAETVLPDYLTNSAWLMFGVTFGVVLLGIPSAALVSLCEFSGRRLVSLLLLLPLACPAYILAYTYTGILDPAGMFAGVLPQTWLASVRSLPGAILMFSLVLYPYVYLLARASFLSQSVRSLEVGRSLGLTPAQAFFRLALPMARPAIAAGITLALMETLADYGTVQFFGVPTFTTGIMRAFYGMGDAAAAAQLASTLLLFVAVLVLAERFSRRRIRYFGDSDQGKSSLRVPLHGWKGVLALVLCLLPPTLGLFVPGVFLVQWALTDALGQWSTLIPLAFSSFVLALIAALSIVFGSLILGYAQRLSSSIWVRLATVLAGLGYALPGTIIAIGVLIPVAALDRELFLWARESFGVNIGLIFTGTIAALVLAYGARFTAVSLGAITSGLGRVKPSLDEVAILAGYRPVQILRRIHVPLMRASVLTAGLIVFVDVLKELPATLVLRPFDFNTLAVRAYELAGDERLIDAAPASLAIVLVGLIPVILLNRSVDGVQH